LNRVAHIPSATGTLDEISSHAGEPQQDRAAMLLRPSAIRKSPRQRARHAAEWLMGLDRAVASETL
jgi:hypothetical protein